MSSPFIQVSGLRKSFRMGRETVHALRGVDLTVQANTFTTIIGPSGSGKSTLLYLLGGLDRPTAGSVTVNGQTLEALDENELARYRRRTVGFIFQSFNLVASMTALENVAFPLRFLQTRPARPEHARELLRQVGLEARAFHRPTELSGGQQQRVAVARALVNDPPLILADEPTGNLDTQSGLRVMELLAELHRRQGRTVLVVTHDPRMTHFATHTLRLLDGNLVAEAEYEAAMQALAGRDEEARDA